VVGDDFEQRVFNSSKEGIMLVYHPITDKNRGLKDKFDQFAYRHSNAGISYFRYNGINESEVFKTPGKLPAILYFKSNGEVKECVEFDDVRSHMLLDSTQ